MIADICRREGLRDLDRSGAAALIDEAARLAGDGERISVRIGRIHDLVGEADAIAAEAGRKLIAARDIDRAIAAKDDRAGRMKALEQDLIRRRLVFIDTDGEKAGQVNALTVLSAGGHSFGAPARITASAGPGFAKGVRIERLANDVGHARRRGVKTLAGYINRVYAPSVPLCLLASVAFEQCYGPIDGDSAGAAELIAILSAIAGIPLKQGIAITGSVDQHGAMQPVGNVNQKIEGFFDVCRMRGLTGQHGVIVPKANLANLMLREAVADAAGKARFAIYAVDSFDEAIEVLTGLEAGVRKNRRGFARGTFHRRVSDVLLEFARPRVMRPIHLDRWWGT
jgi:predicted ATP-dependent protease